MLFTDKIALSGTRRTGDGYLVADARVARTGIQIYLGREVGKPEMEQVRVFRPEAEVFSNDALASFAHRPVTNDHPSEAVGARNWKQHSVGMTGGDIARDGEFVRVPMTVMDQAAIDAVEAGKRELSMGYACDLDWTAGTTPEGEAYDARQTNIRGNHLAIVAAGRAGPQCRIGDSWADLSPNKEPLSMKTLMVDGITVEMSDTAVQVVSKVLQQLSDAKATVDAHEKKIGELNTAISTKDGEIAVLKRQVEDGKMTPAQIDAAVVARSAVIADAKAITGADVTADGKTDADIRRAAVEAKLADEAKGMDDVAIASAFKALRVVAGDATPDPIRDAYKGGLKSVANDAWNADAFASAGVSMKKGA